MEKSIDEIYEEMLSVFGEASGYLPHSSCDLAARLYAAAAQIRGLYHLRDRRAALRAVHCGRRRSDDKVRDGVYDGGGHPVCYHG